jgi:hypothetical protein
MTSCVLFALTAAPDGRASALLPVDGVSAVARLVQQFARLDVAPDVVTWDGWVEAVEAALPPGTPVRSVADLTGAIAAVADAWEGDRILLSAGTVLHTGALQALVRDPRPGSLVLVDGQRELPASPSVGPDVAPIRRTEGQLVSAGSSHHRTDDPDGRSLGVLRVVAEDRPALDDAVTALQPLVSGWGSGPAGAGSRSAHLDPVALVLVALLRRGLTVRTVDRSAWVWAHPADHEGAAAASASLAATSEAEAAMIAAVKVEDSTFTTYLVSPWTRHLVRVIAPFGVTPNQVTVVSMLVGVAAAAAFAAGSRPWALAGALLLQLAFALDCVDGQLARYQARYSAFGAWLDSTFDRGKEYIVYAGLAAGAVRAGDDGTVWLLAAVALALQTVRHVVDFGYGVRPREPVPIETGPVTASRAAQPPRPGPASTSDGAPSRGLAQQLVGWLRRTQHLAWLRALKSSLILPIGERFALISVLAALTDPTVTFVALIAWGAFAALYTLTGRVVRAVA